MKQDALNGNSVGLVVPLFKSWNHVESLVVYVNQVRKEIGGDVSVTFVVDGCPQSESAIRNSISLIECPARLVVLSRNFGVGPALRAAMSVQDEQFTIAFGSDLQEPRDLFVQFASDLRLGHFDFVFGQRNSRQDPFLTKVFSNVFWRLNRKLVFPDCPPGGFDVFGCNSVARDGLVMLDEHRTNITSQMLWLGLRRKFVAFDRISRTEGKSTWSFRKKIGLFIDSFVAFTLTPLKLGLVCSLLLPVIISAATFDTHFSVVLWLLALIVWVLCFALVAPYLTRLFDGNRNRPTFVISKVEFFHPSS